MDKFILDWGTEVALVIALLGSSFIVWVMRPQRQKLGLMWRVAQSSLVLTGLAAIMYGYALKNGVNL
jgi:hypothetical protein